MVDATEYRKKIDPSREEYEFDEWPFYNLVRLTSLYHQKMDTTLKTIGLDVPRWRVLNILVQRDYATVTEISLEAVSKMSTMAKIVQRMTVQGLVETRMSATDARATEVMLTAQGRVLLEQARRKAAAVAHQAFYTISDEELQVVNRITRKIYGNLSP